MGKVESIYSEAQKQLRRIQKIARRIEKRGYTFDLPYGKTKGGGEKKRFTAKELEQLRNVRAKDLYKYAEAFGYSGEEYHKKELQARAKKAAKARKEKADAIWQRELNERLYGQGIYDTIISNFIDSGWIHLTEIGKSKVKEYLERKISIYGKQIVASALEEATHDGTAIVLKQQAYDFNVSIMLLGEAGLEQYFAQVYNSAEEAEEESNYARSLQSEMDDYEYDYPDELLPFDFEEEE